MKSSVWLWILIFVVIIIIILLLTWWSWPWGCLPTKQISKQQAENIYVTVAKKDKTHPNYNKGSDMGYLIDGVQGKAILLKKNKRYRFIVKADGYPFYIGTVECGGNTLSLENSSTSSTQQSKTEECRGSIDIYGTPVENGSFNLVVTKELPQPLYYCCNNQEFMGSSIIIE